MGDETCAQCRFGQFHPETFFKDAPGMVSQRAFVMCRRFPAALKKGATDWCGEFSSALGGDHG